MRVVYNLQTWVLLLSETPIAYPRNGMDWCSKSATCAPQPSIDLLMVFMAATGASTNPGGEGAAVGEKFARYERWIASVQHFINDQISSDFHVQKLAFGGLTTEQSDDLTLVYHSSSGSWRSWSCKGKQNRWWRQREHGKSVGSSHGNPSAQGAPPRLWQLVRLLGSLLQVTVRRWEKCEYVADVAWISAMIPWLPPNHWWEDPPLLRELHQLRRIARWRSAGRSWRSSDISSCCLRRHRCCSCRRSMVGSSGIIGGLVLFLFWLRGTTRYHLFVSVSSEPFTRWISVMPPDEERLEQGVDAFAEQHSSYAQCLQHFAQDFGGMKTRPIQSTIVPCAKSIQTKTSWCFFRTYSLSLGHKFASPMSWQRPTLACQQIPCLGAIEERVSGREVEVKPTSTPGRAEKPQGLEMPGVPNDSMSVFEIFWNSYISVTTWWHRLTSATFIFCPEFPNPSTSQSSIKPSINQTKSIQPAIMTNDHRPSSIFMNHHWPRSTTFTIHVKP